MVVPYSQSILRTMAGYRLGCSLLLLLIWPGLCSCNKDKPIPVSEAIRHVWTLQTVRENNTLVYTKGGTSNIRNYTSFRLDLNNPPAATITDVDGIACTGQYELLNDTKLTLKNLQPQPTGTNGTIEFIINSVTDSALDITRTTTNAKTGSTVNQYQLNSN